MTVPDLNTARRVVGRYAFSTQPRHTPAKGDLRPWQIVLRNCVFRAVKGQEMRTDLSVLCTLPCNGPLKERRNAAAKASTADGKERLAEFLLKVFARKRGFAGYRGWFQCVELVSVYDPFRRRVVQLDGWPKKVIRVH